MSCKQNVILMGDSLGDAKMDQGVPDINTVLKIGFLYGTERVVRPEFFIFLRMHYFKKKNLTFFAVVCILLSD